MFNNGDRVEILGTSFTGTVIGREPGEGYPCFRVQLDTDSAVYSAVFTVRADSLFAMPDTFLVEIRPGHYVESWPGWGATLRFCNDKGDAARITGSADAQRVARIAREVYRYHHANVILAPESCRT